MKTLLVIAVLIALMAVGGWLVFSYKGGTASVEFRTDEAKRDVEKVIDDTRSLMEGAKSGPADPTTTIENPPPAINNGLR